MRQWIDELGECETCNDMSKMLKEWHKVGRARDELKNEWFMTMAVWYQDCNSKDPRNLQQLTRFGRVKHIAKLVEEKGSELDVHMDEVMYRLNKALHKLSRDRKTKLDTRVETKWKKDMVKKTRDVVGKNVKTCEVNGMIERMTRHDNATRLSEEQKQGIKEQRTSEGTPMLGMVLSDES